MKRGDASAKRKSRIVSICMLMLRAGLGLDAAVG